MLSLRCARRCLNRLVKPGSGISPISSRNLATSNFRIGGQHVVGSESVGTGDSTCHVSELISHEAATAGGSEKAQHRHTVKNGKLLVRERLKLLLDADEKFLELSAHAGYKLYNGETVSAGGVVTGVGVIDGVRCMIIANDATVKGGTIYPIGLQKQLRAQQIAIENHLPCVYLVDSGGAFLPMQDEIFNPGGQIFFNEAIMNAMELPSLAVICGSCTAGAAYVPAMADEAIIVDKIGTVFLAGPPLVFAATGEKVSSEQLGGAKVHCKQSGLCDYFAADEVEAIEMAREAVPLTNFTDRIESLWSRTDVFDAPKFDIDDLRNLCSRDSNGEIGDVDMKEVIGRITDGSRFKEFKVEYGPSILCGWAQIHGHPVAIVANATQQMCAEGGRKSAQFVQIASKRRVPLLFLQNTNSVEEGGTKAGSGTVETAGLMHAVACSKVPKISLLVGDSIGPGSFAMGGRGLQPNFTFSLPSSRVAMDSSGEESAIRGDVPHAMYATARLWDDGVLQYHETREALGGALDSCRFRINSEGRSNYGVMRL